MGQEGLKYQSSHSELHRMLQMEPAVSSCCLCPCCWFSLEYLLHTSSWGNESLWVLQHVMCKMFNNCPGQSFHFHFFLGQSWLCLHCLLLVWKIGVTSLCDLQLQVPKVSWPTTGLGNERYQPETGRENPGCGSLFSTLERLPVSRPTVVPAFSEWLKLMVSNNTILLILHRRYGSGIPGLFTATSWCPLLSNSTNGITNPLATFFPLTLVSVFPYESWMIKWPSSFTQLANALPLSPQQPETLYHNHKTFLGFRQAGHTGIIHTYLTPKGHLKLDT